MIPCASCHRHIRERERECPFCSTPLRTSAGSMSLFAVALVGVFAFTGCSNEPGSDDEAGTTTSQGSSDDDGATTSDEATTSDTTQTSTETDSDSSTDDWGNSGGSFYAGPDNDMSFVNSCDPWQQDCPEGEKCVPYASSGGTWDASKCVPVLGDGMPGEACTNGGFVDAIDDCDATSICQLLEVVDGELVGTCTALCTGDPEDPICAEGASCLIANSGSINICLPGCDPLAQDCPIADTACIDMPVHPLGGFTCWPLTDPVATGEACSLDQFAGCAAGNDCVSNLLVPDCQADSCCASYCPLDGVDPCQPGTACTAVFEPGRAPAGYENVGLCLLP